MCPAKTQRKQQELLLFHIHTRKRSPERFPTAIPAVQSHHQRPKMHFPIGPPWGPALSSSWYPQGCKTVAAVSGIIITPYTCLSAIHDLFCYFSSFLEAEKIFQKQLAGLAFLSHVQWACSNQASTPTNTMTDWLCSRHTHHRSWFIFSRDPHHHDWLNLASTFPAPDFSVQRRLDTWISWSSVTKETGRGGFQEGTERLELQNFTLQTLGGFTLLNLLRQFPHYKGEWCCLQGVLSRLQFGIRWRIQRLTV